MRKSGIYEIRNLETGKVYIGSSSDIPHRWRKHRLALQGGCHENCILQNSWNKHGGECFQFIILERVDDAGSLIEREQFWIDAVKAADRDNGYNIRKIAESNIGIKHSPEFCAKTAAASTGRRHTLEARARISASHIGIKPSAESKEKNAAAHRGKRPSPETLAKLSKSRIGRTVTSETRAKISAFNKGKSVSPETRARQSLAAQNRGEISPETRAKLSLHSRWHGGRAAVV